MLALPFSSLASGLDLCCTMNHLCWSHHYSTRWKTNGHFSTFILPWPEASGSSIYSLKHYALICWTISLLAPHSLAGFFTSGSSLKFLRNGGGTPSSFFSATSSGTLWMPHELSQTYTTRCKLMVPLLISPVFLIWKPELWIPLNFGHSDFINACCNLKLKILKTELTVFLPCFPTHSKVTFYLCSVHWSQNPGHHIWHFNLFSPSK